MTAEAEAEAGNRAKLPLSSLLAFRFSLHKTENLIYFLANKKNLGGEKEKNGNE